MLVDEMSTTVLIDGELFTRFVESGVEFFSHRDFFTVQGEINGGDFCLGESTISSPNGVAIDFPNTSVLIFGDFVTGLIEWLGCIADADFLSLLQTFHFFKWQDT